MQELRDRILKEILRVVDSGEATFYRDYLDTLNRLLNTAIYGIMQGES